jgi:hypothetical protein
MKKLLTIGASLAFVLVAGMAFSGSVRAEGEDTHTKTAADGDSMTTLARSVVAEQSASQKVTLSSEAKTYAETVVVQNSGPREIQVGENVVFKKTLVGDTIASATKLSAQELSAWKPYADLIDFGSSTVAGTSVTPGASAKETEGTSSSSAADVTDTAKDAVENTAKSSSNNWYWWPIGLVTLGGLYYILGGRPGKDTE